MEEERERGKEGREEEKWRADEERGVRFEGSGAERGTQK